VDTFLEILEIRLSDLIMSPETGRTPSINIGICESDRAAIAGGRLSERTLAGHGAQTMWDKYGLAKLAGKGFETNTLIMECAAANNSIPALQKRGVVFMSCHNAIWEYTAKLIETGVNPDELPIDALAAELTNHLAPGVVLTPGAVATLPELQCAGFPHAR
jgi:hypothetical protein